MAENQYYRKANTLEEIDNAVRFDVPINADHEFYTDFSDVRGDFEAKSIYKTLNVALPAFTYNDELHSGNKSLLFLAGMRGSGKTTELAQISQKLNHKDCFFCVTCNLDVGLDLNDMEYMDILIFQLERLSEELYAAGYKFEDDIVGSMQEWFGDRIKEINRVIKQSKGVEMEVKAGIPSLLGFLGFTSKVKANLVGSKENAEKIRTVFRTNFSDFAKKVNEFIEYVNRVLRADDKAREILFIIDGIEKSATPEIRKKIVLEEANRIRQIKANTIFTLPIELMRYSQNLQTFSTVVSFPFVKIKERNGDVVENAVKRFEEFTFRRISEDLFDSKDTVRQAIMLGGGSPRELLRILEYANLYADETSGIIDRKALDKGVKKLAAQTAQYLTEADLTALKKLKEDNEKGFPTPYGQQWQDLLEKLIILEYNDGTYKRVNPIVEESELYQHHVR